MQEFRIFYSWQSDHPNSLNRGFISDALEKAAKTIKLDDKIAVTPFIDRDTKDVPGSPHIVNTILKKIDLADVFVADITIVTEASAKRAIPNPNVLMELGYALKALGNGKVILVFNTAFGDISRLPFDLSHLRVNAYQVNELTTDKAEQRNRLSKSLEANLKAIIESHTPKSANQVVEPTTYEQIESALVNDANPILVKKIITTETDKILLSLNEIPLFKQKQTLKPDETAHLILACDKELSNLLSIIAFGTANGEEKYSKIWAENLTYLADRTAPARYVDDLRFYPALVYFYAAGVAAVANQNYKNLAALFNLPKLRNIRYESFPVAPAHALVPYRVIDSSIANKLPGLERVEIPISYHLFNFLQKELNLVIPNNDDFYEAFIRFEYLFTLAVNIGDTQQWGGGAPVAFYFRDEYFRRIHTRHEKFIAKAVDAEIEKFGEKWQPFNDGVFNVDWSKFLEFKKNADQSIKAQITERFPNLTY